MLREAIWDEITEALDELPREQREIFIQNEIEEKSFREISEATGYRSIRCFRESAMRSSP